MGFRFDETRIRTGPRKTTCAKQSATIGSALSACSKGLELSPEWNRSPTMPASRLFLFSEQPVIEFLFEEVGLPTGRACDGFTSRALD